MSPTLTDCPSLQALEDVARGISTDDSTQRHALVCDACRSKVEEIARNNALMAELADAVETRPARPLDGRFPVVDGYEIQQRIGQGGQGAIFRAIQRATKRRVAIKVLMGGRFASPHQRNRFEREVELAAGLRHPNIVTMFDRGVTADGRQYSVMEFVDGATLAALLADDGPAGWPARSLEAKLKLFCKLCAAVEYAHRHAVIHRDLKPPNILVDQHDEPRIVDFGLAKAVDSLSLQSAHTVTQAGEFAGTFAYASPEQTCARPDLIDTRTDVYSLGIILFEMLTGRLPYKTSGPPAEVLKAIAETPPHRPSEFSAVVNDEIDTIVLKALAKEPQRRYQSAGELLADIERYQTGRPIEAKRDSTWYVLSKTAHRHRFAVGLALIFVLLVAGFAVSMVFVARDLARQRDLAESERKRADRNSSLLSRSVREANIERGRALCLAGDIRTAEELLWTEYLRPSHDADDEPLQQAAKWALRELYARNPCLMTLDSGQPRVCLGISADRSRAVLSSLRSREIKFLDIPTFQLTTCLLENPDGIGFHKHQFSPDGKRLVALGKGGVVRVWDIATRKQVSTFIAGGDLTSAEFSPNSHQIVVCGDQGRILLLDPTSGQLVRRLDGHAGAVTSAIFSPDGSQIASCAYDGTLRLWDAQSGACRVLFKGKPEQPVWRAEFPLDGKSLAACAVGFGVGLWNISEGRLTEMLQIGGNSQRLSFRPDGRMLAVGTGASICIWNVQSRRIERKLAGHTAFVSDIGYFGDGDTLLSVEAESVRVWDVGAGAGIMKLRGHGDSVLSACFSPDRSRLFSGSADAHVMVWDLRSGKLIQKIPHKSAVESVSTSRNGLLATAAHERSVYLWDLETAQSVGAINGFDDRVNALCFSPDGSQLFTATMKGTVQGWNSTTHTELRHFPNPREAFSSLSANQSGKLLAAGAKISNSIYLWNYETAVPLRPLLGHKGPVRSIQFNSTGALLASASDDQTLRLWDMNTMTCRATLAGTHARIYGVCFSPDDSMLASCDDGGEIRIWDTDSGRCIALYQGSAGALLGLSFCRDADHLACWGGFGELFVQNLRYFDRHISGNQAHWENRIRGGIPGATASPITGQIPPAHALLPGSPAGRTLPS